MLLEKGPRIIEEIQVFKNPQSVKNILLSDTKVLGSAYYPSLHLLLVGGVCLIALHPAVSNRNCTVFHNTDNSTKHFLLRPADGGKVQRHDMLSSDMLI